MWLPVLLLLQMLQPTIMDVGKPFLQRRGEAFSPTDTVATALASCMLTVMGIKAQQMGLNMDGTSCEVTKVMYAEPRRIGEIHINMIFPAKAYSDKDKAILENTARTCPVFYSLHPDLKKEISLRWL